MAIFSNSKNLPGYDTYLEWRKLVECKMNRAKHDWVELLEDGRIAAKKAGVSDADFDSLVELALSEEGERLLEILNRVRYIKGVSEWTIERALADLLWRG